MCVRFFWAVNIMISWFVFTLELSARLQNTRQCICSDWKTLENQSANLQANSGLEGILSKHFFFVQEKALKFELLFIVYCKRSLPSPFCKFWHVTSPNRHAHLRIMPILTRIRNPPIRNAHLGPWDSVGYWNELLCTNSTSAVATQTWDIFIILLTRLPCDK